MSTKYKFFLIIPALVLCVFLLIWRVNKQTDFESLLTEYSLSQTQSSVASESSDEHEAYLNYWQDRFLEALEDSDSSAPYYESTLMSALVISNTLGNYDVSEKLISSQLELYEENSEFKFEILNDLAEINYYKYFKSRSETDLSSSVNAFEEVVQYFDEHYPDLTKVGSSSAIAYASNMAKYGELLYRDLKEVNRSALLDRSMREFIQNLSTETKSSLELLNYTVETFASREMEKFFSLKDFENAEMALEALKEIEEPRHPISYYFDTGVKLAFPDRGKEFQDYVNNWLLANEPDERTPMLECQLALDYEATGQDNKAYDLFQKIWNENSDFLIEYDLPYLESAPSGKMIGYSPTILSSLIRFSLQFEQLDLAEQYLAEFKEHFSQDARFETLSNMVARNCQLQTRL